MNNEGEDFVFRPKATKEVFMYESAEQFVTVTANAIYRMVPEGAGNFEEVYNTFFADRINSARTPDKEREYIEQEKENVKKLILQWQSEKSA